MPATSHGFLARLALVATFASALLPSCILDRDGRYVPAAAGGHGGAGGATTSSGGSGGAITSSGGGGGGGGELLPPGNYRRNIVVTALAAASAGYALSLRFDHAALVTAGKALASGDDVRVWRDEGGGWSELPRVLDPASGWNGPATQIWFRSSAALSDTTPDTTYYLFYGDSTAPPAAYDGSQVYDIWDGFDDDTLDAAWTVTLVGTASGFASEAAGVVHVEGATGDIWGSSDNFIFLNQVASGDFVLDALVSNSGGSLSGWAKVGGVMLRQGTAAGSRNRIMSPVNGSAARTNSYRLQDDAVTTEQAPAGTNPIPEYARITRVGSSSQAFQSDDGSTWLEIGAAVTFTQPLTDPVLVGVPLANIVGVAGWVEVDWLRLRKLVVPEPSTNLAGEEQAPF